MTPDEMKELRELVEFLKENGLNEFEFERGDLKIRLKFTQPQQAPASALDIARLGQLLSPAGHTPPAVSQGIHAVASAGSAAAADAAAPDAAAPDGAVPDGTALADGAPGAESADGPIE